jgi:hypothetical protein
MKYHVKLTRQAEQDIDGILTWISNRSPQGAAGVIKRRRAIKNFLLRDFLNDSITNPLPLTVFAMLAVIHTRNKNFPREFSKADFVDSFYHAWLRCLDAMLAKLVLIADRCQLAPENEDHDDEIRQMLFKTRRVDKLPRAHQYQ